MKMKSGDVSLFLNLYHDGDGLHQRNPSSCIQFAYSCIQQAYTENKFTALRIS